MSRRSVCVSIAWRTAEVETAGRSTRHGGESSLMGTGKASPTVSEGRKLSQGAGQPRRRAYGQGPSREGEAVPSKDNFKMRSRP